MALERMCQEYVGAFESSLVELAAENAKLERRIDLNTRYEESVSHLEPKLLAPVLIQCLQVLSCLGNERQPFLPVPKGHYSKADISNNRVLTHILDSCESKR